MKGIQEKTITLLQKYPHVYDYNNEVLRILWSQKMLNAKGIHMCYTIVQLMLTLYEDETLFLLSKI